MRLTMDKIRKEIETFFKPCLLDYNKVRYVIEVESEQRSKNTILSVSIYGAEDADGVAYELLRFEVYTHEEIEPMIKIGYQHERVEFMFDLSFLTELCHLVDGYPTTEGGEAK